MTKRVIQKKACLLGDFAVGKTSLIRRFVEGRFDDRYLSTIGVKISRRAVDFADYTLNLLIWDLAGGDDFSQAGGSYLRGSVAALIVCDLTRHETLGSFQYYADQLRALNPETVLVFAGNKVDLTDERSINEDELRALSQTLNGRYLDTSAKNGYQVKDAFQLLAEQIKI
ncbi:MAG: GTP-binding protein [Chloroflexi bacterium]|nr:GTP-binding protein [Chloroflexota bacterium]